LTQAALRARFMKKAASDETCCPSIALAIYLLV